MPGEKKGLRFFSTGRMKSRLTSEPSASPMKTPESPAPMPRMSTKVLMTPPTTPITLASANRIAWRFSRNSAKGTTSIVSRKRIAAAKRMNSPDSGASPMATAIDGAKRSISAEKRIEVTKRLKKAVEKSGRSSSLRLMASEATFR